MQKYASLFFHDFMIHFACWAKRTGRRNYILKIEQKSNQFVPAFAKLSTSQNQNQEYIKWSSKDKNKRKQKQQRQYANKIQTYTRQRHHLIVN